MSLLGTPHYLKNANQNAYGCRIGKSGFLKIMLHHYLSNLDVRAKIPNSMVNLNNETNKNTYIDEMLQEIFQAV